MHLWNTGLKSDYFLETKEFVKQNPTFLLTFISYPVTEPVFSKTLTPGAGGDKQETKLSPEDMYVTREMQNDFVGIDVWDLSICE